MTLTIETPTGEIRTATVDQESITKKTQKLLFTDTHFGIKQNSTSWLKSQEAFIYEQLIPTIDTLHGDVVLVHLGDVFDSRSTISTMVASHVLDMFRVLTEKVKKFIIIGGNHDYYSPNTDSIDTINLLIRQIPGINVVTKECLIDGDDLYVPWYQWSDHWEDVKALVKKHDIKNIYTHADIVMTPPSDLPSDVKVYSGHIHVPSIKGNMFNLGSCYAQSFMDSNTERGFYYINYQADTFTFLPNRFSIKFHRLHNEDIFKDVQSTPGDYFELYISRQNLISDRYTKRISELASKYKNIFVIPEAEQIEYDGTTDFCKYDIESICRKDIPTDLIDKFDKIIQTIKNRGMN